MTSRLAEQVAAGFIDTYIESANAPDRDFVIGTLADILRTSYHAGIEAATDELRRKLLLDIQQHGPLDVQRLLAVLGAPQD